MNKKRILTTVSMLLTLTTALAQGTVADYQRAAAIRGKYSNKVAFGDVRVHRMRDEHKFWYSVFDGEKQIYKEVDADKNTVTLLPENPERQQQRQWPRGGGQQRHWAEVPNEMDGSRQSPDERVRIFVRDYNLWARQGENEPQAE